MVGTSLDTDVVVGKAAQKELVRFKMQMDDLKERLAAAPDKEGKLREACKDFEAVFISKMWKEMKNTVPKGGVFGSRQSEMYMSMFDRDFAEKMADSGGIGLGDMLYDQLKDKLKQSSRDALAGKVEIKPLKPETAGIPLAPATVNSSDLFGNRTIDQWMSSESDPQPRATDVGAQTAPITEASLSDAEVNARIEAMTRRIENRHKGARVATSAYGGNAVSLEDKAVGKKLAKIG